MEVSVTWARKHWGQMLRRVSEQGESFTLTQHGKPVAVVTPIKEIDEQSKALDELTAQAQELGMGY